MAGEFTAVFEIADEPAFRWLKARYPNMQVSHDGSKVRLVCADLSCGELELVWACSRANEALLLRGEAQRTALREELLA
jgi:hypothetical protein